MRLKRLELQGFKSFVDRTILEFDKGITGVVGPNGCGKSNIVDAMMWVMGEQSAKHLRGESMSDVIFSGSETQAPTSMAEVSLVMESTGANIPPHLLPRVQGDEISISRRLFRDGTAEYLINKQLCRLKDIHELFMDTGVGRRAYSVIEQGQIDRMINVKPEDRRVILEEVAGITKYRTKKKEAERKLESTRLNLSRVQDIVNELEKQMRSLKIQSSRARKYKEIKQELETVDLYVLGRKLFDLKNEIGKFSTDREALSNDRSSMDAKLSRFEAEATELDIRRIDEEKEIEHLDAKDRELALLVQRLENQVALLDEQKKHLMESGHLLSAEQLDSTQIRDSLQADTQKLLIETTDLEKALESLDAQIQGIESELSAAQSTRHGIIKEFEAKQTQLVTISKQQVQLKNQMEHGVQRMAELDIEHAELGAKLTEVVLELDSQRENLQKAEVQIESIYLRAQTLETELAAIGSDCIATSGHVTRKEEELYELREDFHSQKSRLQSLKELQESLEGYSPTAKEVLSHLGEANVAAVALADVFKPDADVEAHLEAVLGDSLDTLVVEDTAAAIRLAEWINEKSLERVGIVSKGEMKVGETVSVPGHLIPLINKVRFDEAHSSVVHKYLSNVYLCSSLSELFELRLQYPKATFITLDGKNIAHASGELTCGSLSVHTALFSRRRELEELVRSSGELSEQVEAATRERGDLLAQLEAQEKVQDQLKETLSALHIERAELRKEKERLQGDVIRLNQEHQQWVDKSAKVVSSRDEMSVRTQQCEVELSEIGENQNLLQAEASNLEAQNLEVSEKISQLGQSISDQRVERSKLNERYSGIAEKHQKIVVDLSRVEDRLRSIAQRLEQEASQQQALGEQARQVLEQKSEAGENQLLVLAKLADVQNAHAQTSTKLNELRLQKDQLNKSREKLFSDIQEVELGFAQAQSDFEHQRNISVERYQHEASLIEPGDDSSIDIEKLPLFMEQLKVEWTSIPVEERMGLLDEHITNLRSKAERYGEVNLTAIHEFEEVEKRHVFLTEQKTDLESSIGILETAITKIDETTKTRFSETMIGVNEKFKEVFPILFNGGKAELSLTDPTNILESGVDIMVQPPGKRLQSISLLSGGEKALTAVSLILAIFARKPSPFCLLDEVDAPLDDANVSRFNTVVQHMATKSQFILITHNRRTMEMADVLYGVTMERAGVSKMTSVRLH